MKIEKKYFFGFIVRIVLGCVFIYSGFLKLSAPVEEFAYAIQSYEIFSYNISLLAAYIVPWFELYLGVFIFFGVYTVYCSALSTLMFMLFEILLMQAILRKLPIINCGCFGSTHSNSIYTEFLLNLVWIFFSLFSVFCGKYLSIDSYFEKKDINDKTAGKN